MIIQYLCLWEKEKEKSWSGTSYSLLKALSKKVNIVDKGFEYTIFERIIIKMFSVSINNGVLSFKNSFNFFSVFFPSIRAALVCKNVKNESVILEIGDIKKTNVPYYVYQDLSIESLINLKEKDIESFNYSGFQNIPHRGFSMRTKHQNKVYNDAAGIFTMSKWLANYLVEYTGLPENKVHHVGGGINVDLNNIKEIPKYNNKILFVGRDFKRKAGDLVYEAFVILQKELMNNAELYIAGPSEYPLSEINENVKFLGDISSDELSYYYNICDIFCMPSHFEAYGLVFIEALIYGLPCIGRNAFEMKEFIQDGYNGYLIENDDAKELAHRMYTLLLDDEIKSNVKHNRQVYQEEYSWDSVADRIVSVLQYDRNK